MISAGTLIFVSAVNVLDAQDCVQKISFEDVNKLRGVNQRELLVGKRVVDNGGFSQRIDPTLSFTRRVQIC